MKTISGRQPLAASDQESFFAPNGHLNYRYTMLWRHKGGHVRGHGDAICAFESSLIVCRVFMEFLGLGVRYSVAGPVLTEKQDYYSPDGSTTDEVKVVDLGGQFVKTSNLTGDERKVLATVYHMAHKSTAHLTFKAPFQTDASIVHDCVPIIDRLLYEHLYDILGRKPHQWT